MKKEYRTIRLNNYRNFIIASAETALAKKNLPTQKTNESTKNYKKRIRTSYTSTKRSKYSYNLEFKYACLKLWESGMSITAVAEHFDVARSTMYRWKKNFSEMFEALPLNRCHMIQEVNRYETPTIEVKMVSEALVEKVINPELMMVA